MGCHHSEAMREKICQQQDGCVLCPSIPQGCFRVGKGRKNHWFLWHRRLAWAQGRCSGDAELCWDSECRYFKKNVFHRLDASISESELDENQDPIPTRRKPTQLLYSLMFRRINLWPLVLSCPISTSIKDHEVWHLQEEGQEHCFCLAVSPCCWLSTMAMPRANCCLNHFQGWFSIPCNFHGGCAAAAVMKRAPLLWSVPGWSPTCNKDPFFPPDLSAPSTPTSQHYLGHS